MQLVFLLCTISSLVHIHALILKAPRFSFNKHLLLQSADGEIPLQPIATKEKSDEDTVFKGFGKSNNKSQMLSGDTIEKKEEERIVEKEIEGTKMFLSMRQRREDALDEKINQLREVDEQIASDPSVGAVPEVVANRMIGRIATFFGVPVFGGLSIFVAAFFVSKKYDMVIQPSIVAYATQVPFVLGLAGISYGILSSSWDEKVEGSALGVTEFKTNTQRIKDGITRTRETAELRDEIENEKKKLGRRD